MTDARVEDSGEYACQVAHHGDMEDEMDMTFSLRVLGEERERVKDALEWGIVWRSTVVTNEPIAVELGSF